MFSLSKFDSPILKIKYAVNTFQEARTKHNFLRLFECLTSLDKDSTVLLNLAEWPGDSGFHDIVLRSDGDIVATEIQSQFWQTSDLITGYLAACARVTAISAVRI